MKGVTIIEEYLCRAVELPALIGGGLFLFFIFHSYREDNLW